MRIIKKFKKISIGNKYIQTKTSNTKFPDNSFYMKHISFNICLYRVIHVDDEIKFIRTVYAYLFLLKCLFNQATCSYV